MTPQRADTQEETTPRPEPKFRIGQVVVMTGLKRPIPFIVRNVMWAMGGWCYAWNRKNYATEDQLRELTPEESGAKERT